MSLAHLIVLYAIMTGTFPHVMSRPGLFFVCPACQQEFELRGPRLKDYLRRKKVKPEMVGPFCNYRCSSARNVSLATRVAKEKLVPYA